MNVSTMFLIMSKQCYITEIDKTSYIFRRKQKSLLLIHFSVWLRYILLTFIPLLPLSTFSLTKQNQNHIYTFWLAQRPIFVLRYNDHSIYPNRATFGCTVVTASDDVHGVQGRMKLSLYLELKEIIPKCRSRRQLKRSVGIMYPE